MRVKLIVAYDGTNYCGWQIQPNAVTVESVLNEALTGLLREEIRVIGASRTDSGVHALGNVAVFDTDTRIPAEKISYALNAMLSEDIRIQKSEQVADDFHPRHCDTIKTYEYRILNREFALPTKRYDSIHCYRNLDLEQMRAAAAHLVGTHDFKSFCSVKTQTETTVRTIYSLEVLKQDEMIIIRVRGNGFLYNMVRIIAGTLMEVGTGHKTPGQVEEALMSKDRTLAGATAPARGLTLVGIEYLERESEWQG